MPVRKRSRPLVQFEHGTRIYAPTPDTPRYRIVAVDPVSGKRHFFRVRTEDEARSKARSLDEGAGASRSLVRSSDDRTVGHLAERWIEDHLAGLSRNYRNTQERLLRVWILPRLRDLSVLDWTPAESEVVLNALRVAGRSDALRQDVGAAMRAMVTHARRMRWLTSRDEDPMWLVRYTPKGGIQGQSNHYVPRRVLKSPKNGRVRTSIFPRSLADDLRALRDDVCERCGPEGLLFPSRSGALMHRGGFQGIWARSAELAGWQMKRPTARTTPTGKAHDRLWTGSAVWTPHDLRHVAACWMLFDLRLDPAVVAAKLGHADPSFTVKRYVGIRGDADLQAMAVTEEW